MPEKTVAETVAPGCASACQGSAGEDIVESVRHAIEQCDRDDGSCTACAGRISTELVELARRVEQVRRTSARFRGVELGPDAARMLQMIGNTSEVTRGAARVPGARRIGDG